MIPEQFELKSEKVKIYYTCWKIVLFMWIISHWHPQFQHNQQTLIKCLNIDFNNVYVWPFEWNRKFM